MAVAGLMWARIVVCGSKAKETKPVETARLVLKPAQLAEMIDPMFKGLDVAIKHGAGAATTHFVPGAMDLEANFLLPFHLPRQIASRTPGSEHLRAASGNRAQPVLPQQFEAFPGSTASECAVAG